jgi:hypothetical protein
MEQLELTKETKVKLIYTHAPYKCNVGVKEIFDAA